LAEKIIAPSDKNEPKIFYGYVIVFVGFVLQVFGWGIFNSFGVFFKPLETEFIWSRAVVASAMSFSFLVAGFAGILMGELSDRFNGIVIVGVLFILHGHYRYRNKRHGCCGLIYNGQMVC
jgi:MFS family permease